MAHVVFRDPALISMIVSSIEVFKKETFGILIGKKSGKNYIIKQAVNVQNAKRDYYYVLVEKRQENRIVNTLRHLTDNRWTGDFHSHSNGWEKLGPGDVKDIRDQGSGKVFVLVIVKKTNRDYKWIYNARDRSISGSIGKKFFVKLVAYHLNDRTDKIEKLVIKAPLTKTFNRRAKHFEKLEKKLKKVEKETKHRVKTKKKLKEKLKRV